MNPLEIEKRLHRLLDQLRDALPPEQLAEMKELVAAGEPGVALENCCTQLFEFGAVVPPAVVNELEELGLAMAIDERHWGRLRNSACGVTESRSNTLEILRMLQGFVSGEDRSVSLAGRLETAIDRAFPEDSAWQDLVLALASYRPGGGNYLYDEDRVAALCAKMISRLG